MKNTESLNSSQNNLYQMYMENNWNKLSENEKVNLLQETITKEQEKLGVDIECNIYFVPLGDNCFGEHIYKELLIIKYIT